MLKTPLWTFLEGKFLIAVAELLLVFFRGPMLSV